MRTARDIAASVNNGTDEAVALVQNAIEAATQLDDDLHFLAEPWYDDALRWAADLDQLPFSQRGLLAGVPIMIKAGSGLETPLVERLVAAGAVPIGTPPLHASRLATRAAEMSETRY